MASVVMGADEEQQKSKTDWFRIATVVSTLCFPLITGTGGYLLGVVIDHDRKITTMSATKADQTSVSSEIKGLTESVHKLELHIAESNRQILDEIRAMLRDK